MLDISDEELNRIVEVMIRTANKLIADGILTVDSEGFKLTPQGKAWVAIRDKLRTSNGGSS